MGRKQRPEDDSGLRAEPRNLREVRVLFYPTADAAHEHLRERAPVSKIERSVLNSVEQKISTIRSNPFFGEPVAKWRIPRRYVKQIAVDNMHWVPLANFWRMLYTLRHTPGQAQTSALILDILSHPEYDKLMGYKKDRSR